MGASEAGGGKRGRWGQARLVGAGEANGGRKPPGQIPCQQCVTNQKLGNDPIGRELPWILDGYPDDIWLTRTRWFDPTGYEFPRILDSFDDAWLT